MQYKTIVLELIEQNQPLYQHLRRCRTLLATVERSAAELRASHREWIARLTEAGRGGTAEQRSAEALELALTDLTERLRPESAAPDTDGPSPAGAMAFLRTRSPRG